MRACRAAFACGLLFHLLSRIATAGPEAAVDRPELPPKVPTLALADALLYMRAHRGTLEAQRARLAAARAEVRAATFAWIPSVGAVAQVVGSTTNNSTATFLADSAVPIPRIGATPLDGGIDWSPSASTLVAVGLRQQIYDFGRIGAQRALAAAQLAIEGAQGDELGLDLELAVVSAYYAVLGARGVLETADGALERAQVYTSFIEAGVRSGVRPRIDLTRATADLMRFQVGRLRARTGVRLARSALAATIGSPEREIDATPVDVPRSGASEPSDVGEATLMRTPRLRLLAGAVSMQEAQTRVLSAQQRPSLFLSASLSARAGGAQPTAGPVPTGDGWLPVVPNYHAAVVLSWPVWEPVTYARTRASKQREEALRAQLRDERNIVEHQIADARAQSQLAVESLSALERAEAAARANQDQAETRLRAGLGTVTELADASALLLNAQMGLVLGRYQMMIARAAMMRLVAERP